MWVHYRECLRATGRPQDCRLLAEPKLSVSAGSASCAEQDILLRNTVEVTMNDLSLIGRAIDAASQAGANNVQGLRFALQDQEPSRQQALGWLPSSSRSKRKGHARGDSHRQCYAHACRRVSRNGTAAQNRLVALLFCCCCT